MYVKIHSDKKSKNKGSCNYLVDYLEKENIEKNALNQELFFNQDRTDIDPFTVRNAIDSNKAKLGANESKFYMISVNPSKAELKHICKGITGRDVSNISGLTKNELRQYEASLKNYSRSVMEEYAKNFNKGLSGKDLLYFGKVEHERHYSYKDESLSKTVQQMKSEGKNYETIIKEFNNQKNADIKMFYENGIVHKGDLKEGFQSHVHIIVSRKDITNKIKLSPMATARRAMNKLPNGTEKPVGFDRKLFVQTCEKTFDSQFAYKRSQNLSFSHYHTMKNSMRSVAYSALRDIPMVTEIGKTDRTVRTITSIANAKDPLDALTAAFRQVPVARECMKSISYFYNPSKLAFDIGRKALTTVLSSGL